MTKIVVTIRQAKKDFSRLIQKAAGGLEVIVLRGSKPVARIVPFDRLAVERRPGSFKGKLIVGPEFFEPLPPDELFG